MNDERLGLAGVFFVVWSLSACGSASSTPERGNAGTTSQAAMAGAASGGPAGGSGGTNAGSANVDGGGAGSAGSANAPACALRQFKGDGYILNVLASGELASLEISSADFKDISESPRPLYTRWPTVVAPYFKDEFFWHMYVLHEHLSSNPLRGANRGIRPPALGLQMDGPGKSTGNPDFSAQTKLTALLFMQDDMQFGSVTMMHEIIHTWGQFVVPELSGAHWDPVSDVNGFLGGSPRGGITDLGDGTFEVKPFDPDQNTAADIEMYLAGLWAKEKVQPFHWLRNPVFLSHKPDHTGSIYSGSELVTVTIDDLIAKYGPRVPDATTSIHDFRALPIVVTDVPLTPGDWDFYRWQLAAFQAQTPPPPYDRTHTSLLAPPNRRRFSASTIQQNFRSSMHDMATLKTDDLIPTLVSPGECIAELPGIGDACARLIARAASCGVIVVAPDCGVDKQFTTTDASCIADCADQTNCDDVAAAAAGIQGNYAYNTYAACAARCQCLEVRGCLN